MSGTLTIAATGFAQPAKLSNGLAAARRAILEKNPDANVLLYSWKAHELVSSIAASIVVGNPDRIVMAGHSYGFWLCSLIASELWDVYQIKTDSMLSADGVERGNPRNGTLRISPGVVEVWAWFQTTGIIKGSQIIVTPPTKLVQTEVHVIHPRVDEVAEFQSKLIELATQT